MKNWIPKDLKKGALSKTLGIPEDKNIPISVLKAHSKGNSKTAKRSRLALTLKKFK